MTYKLRYTLAARADIRRLYGFLLQRDQAAAEKAVDVIIRAVDGLKEFPFSARKASAENTFLRELVIPFGSAGYVVLFEIEDARTISIYAVRHQREDDYH